MDMNTQMRLTGLATGLDTDALIQNLGRVHTMRIDTVKRDRQYALWRQEGLRNTIDMVNTFVRSNLNIANPSSNFRSATAFAKFSYNLSVGGVATEANKAAAAKVVSVTANGDLRNFNQTIEKVTQLATKDTWEGGKADLRSIKTDGFDVENFIEFDKEDTGAVTGGRAAVFGISIDGVSRTISIDGNQMMELYQNNPNKEDRAAAFAKAVNDKISASFGGGTYYANIMAVGSDGELSVQRASSNITLFEAAPGMTMLKDLGFPAGGASTGDVNRKTLDELFGTGIFGTGSDSGIVINGVNIAVDGKDTLSTLMNKINSSDAGVTLSYNSAADKFTLTSKNEGTASNIGDIGHASTVKLFSAMKLGAAVEVNREIKVDSSTVVNMPGLKLVMGDGLSLREYSDMSGLGIGQGNEMFMVKGDDGKTTGAIKFDGTDFIHVKYELDADGDIVFDGDDPRIIGEDTIIKDEALELLGLGADGVGKRTEGKNLIAQINGVEFVRQSNTFTFEGMTFTFSDTFNIDGTEDAIKIGVTKNTTEIIDSIKNFVDEYNKLVDHINGLLNDRKTKEDKEYLPLTDDEKKAMKAEDIKAYEERAKIGMLANDSDLRRLLNDMRSSIYQQVEGVGLTMSDIGITTTPNWKDGGRLVIDETKLTTALENNYDQVVSLFTQASDISYDDRANRSKRTAQSGIAQRLNDVLNDAVRTTTGSSNSKGYLIEKAGMKNDASVVNNTIQKQIETYDKRIQTLLERWYRQENSLYATFARMETAMSKMQSQQNSLAQLLAQSGS